MLFRSKSVDLQDNDTFAMTVGNVLYEDKKEAGEALIAACAGLKTVSTGGKVGEYHAALLLVEIYHNHKRVPLQELYERAMAKAKCRSA